MGKTVSSFYNSALNRDYVDVRISSDHLQIPAEEPLWRWGLLNDSEVSEVSEVC